MLKRPPLDLPPGADGAAPPPAAPVVVTDWTAPWASVTVVVTVPLGLSTVVVVVLVDELDPPDALEPPPAEAGAETDVGAGETRALAAPAMAEMPLMMTSGSQDLRRPPAGMKRPKG
jgi:hypothetical protein